LVLAWSTVSAGLVVALGALGAVWYNHHAIYSLKYVVLAWAAIAVVSTTGRDRTTTVLDPGA
jgi:hypothetical protein